MGWLAWALVLAGLLPALGGWIRAGTIDVIDERILAAWIVAKYAVVWILVLAIRLVIDYAKTDMGKKLVRGVINNFGATARPYVVTPGTPKARVEILRRAFMETMKDAEFAGELKKAKLDLNPLDGATLERNIQELFALDPSLIPKLSEILK